MKRVKNAETARVCGKMGPSVDHTAVSTATARRAWIATRQVVNAWPVADLRDWAGRGRRRA